MNTLRENAGLWLRFLGGLARAVISRPFLWLAIAALAALVWAMPK